MDLENVKKLPDNLFKLIFRNRKRRSLCFIGLVIIILLILSFLFVQHYFKHSEILVSSSCLEKHEKCFENDNTPKVPLYLCIEKIIIRDSVFIALIISVSIILVITITCFTIFAIELNRQDSSEMKLELVKEEYSSRKGELDSDKTTMQEKTIEENGKREVVTEYYPKNKAAVDLFKAYASTISDI